MGGLVSRMRVVHLDHSTARGGAEYALLRMLEIHPPWDAVLLIPRDRVGAFGVYTSLRHSPGVVVRQLGPLQRHGASSAGPLGIIAFAAAVIGQAIAVRSSREFRKANVVHANTSRAAVYAALACLLSRRKLVVHLRDLVNRESLGSFGFRLFTGLALWRANAVIANSSATLKSAAPFLRTDVQAVVIPSAAGVRPGSDTESADAAPVSNIGMVARLDPWKGQDLLIRAFAAAFPEGSVRLVLAGSAPFGNERYEEDLRRLAEDLGVKARVDFLGHVDDVLAVISSLDICVQASLRPEPLGQNVLQYLAAGRPTVAADAGGPAEWIRDGENGLLFQPGSEKALAAALVQLAGDVGLRMRLGRAASSTPGLADDVEITERHRELFERVLQTAS